MTPQARAIEHTDRLVANAPRCPVHGTVLVQGWTFSPRGTGEVGRPTGVFHCFACETESETVKV